MQIAGFVKDNLRSDRSFGVRGFTAAGHINLVRRRVGVLWEQRVSCVVFRSTLFLSTTGSFFSWVQWPKIWTIELQRAGTFGLDENEACSDATALLEATRKAACQPLAPRGLNHGFPIANCVRSGFRHYFMAVEEQFVRSVDSANGARSRVGHPRRPMS